MQKNAGIMHRRIKPLKTNHTWTIGRVSSVHLEEVDVEGTDATSRTKINIEWLSWIALHVLKLSGR